MKRSEFVAASSQKLFMVQLENQSCLKGYNKKWMIFNVETIDKLTSGLKKKKQAPDSLSVSVM